MRPNKLLMVTSVLTPLVLTLLVGCASEPAPSQSGPDTPPPAEVRDPIPTDGSLETDRATYTASCQGEGYRKSCTVTLLLTYTNQTDAPVYFDLCYPEDTSPIYGVGALTQEESAYNPNWACVGHNKFIEVRPEEQRVDTLVISGPNAWDGATGEPFGLLGGRMQLGYSASSCSSDLDPFGPCDLPPGATTSNVFTVTLPD